MRQLQRSATFEAPRQTRMIDQLDVRPAAIQRALADISIFKGCKLRTLTTLAHAATQMRLPRRTVVYRPGDECSGLHVVMAGRVKLAFPRNGSPERVVAILGPGDWFGETALLLSEPHVVAAETAEKATLVHLPADAILTCLEEDKLFALRMLTETSRRLRGTMLDSRLAAGSARERVIAFLLEELPSHTKGRGSATIVLPTVKRVIASRLNLTAEHLSRVLHDLAQARLINVQGLRVGVPDVRRLRAALPVPA